MIYDTKISGNTLKASELLLNGEIIITPELNYQLEARSENITSKIKELTKLRFNQTLTN